jgi:hypothetical protein
MSVVQHCMLSRGFSLLCGSLLLHTQCMAMLHLLCSVQALNQRDGDSRTDVEMLLAWPAAQTELYNLGVKQQAEYLASDPKYAES